MGAKPYGGFDDSDMYHANHDNDFTSVTFGKNAHVPGMRLKEIRWRTAGCLGTRARRLDRDKARKNLISSVSPSASSSLASAISTTLSCLPLSLSATASESSIILF